MTTYLLSWNPIVWKWKNIQANIAKVASNGYSEMQWSTGVTKKIKAGDRVFVMKLGVEPRGIVASGWATSDVQQSDNYKATSKPALYIILMDILTQFLTQMQYYLSNFCKTTLCTRRFIGHRKHLV